MTKTQKQRRYAFASAVFVGFALFGLATISIFGPIEDDWPLLLPMLAAVFCWLKVVILDYQVEKGAEA